MFPPLLPARAAPANGPRALLSEERRRKSNLMKRLAVLVIALAGLVLFGQGACIHAKALLAQILLERAFAETIATGRAVKPWSWADTWPVARI